MVQINGANTMSETTVTLVKGEKVDLTKNNPHLKVAAVGLGWDTAAGPKTYDLDAFAIPLKSGKVLGAELLKAIVFYNHLGEYAGIKHGGDNLTGAGDGDDETVMIDLAKVAAAGANEVLVCVNIYDAVSKNQHFGQVNNAFIRIYDWDTKKELLKFDLSEDYSAFNGMIMGKLYLRESEWKFQAIGTGVNGNIEQIATPYKQ